MTVLEMLNGKKAAEKYDDYYFLYVTFLTTSFVWVLTTIVIGITYLLQKGFNFPVLLFLVVIVIVPVIFYQLFKLAIFFKKLYWLQMPISLLYCVLMTIPFMYFKQLHDILGLIMY